MGYYILKVVITTALIVIISEISKRSTFIGAILASVPLVSVLAMVWLYIDTRDVSQVSALATSIFWLVLPSLVLFIMLPFLLKQGAGFPLGLTVSIAATVCAYWLMVVSLGYFGISL